MSNIIMGVMFVVYQGMRFCIFSYLQERFGEHSIQILQIVAYYIYDTCHDMNRLCMAMVHFYHDWSFQIFHLIEFEHINIYLADKSISRLKFPASWCYDIIEQYHLQANESRRWNQMRIDFKNNTSECQ